MLKVLIPVDNTNVSRYALQHVIHRAWSHDSLDIHLIHVQAPLSRYVAQFVASDNMKDFYAERSEKALRAAGRLLERGGLRYSAHARRGDPAREIVRYAESNRFGCIVMASDGLGSLSEMLLGSITAKVLRTSRIPVEVVPAAPRSALRAYAGPTGLGATLLTVLYLALD